MLRMHIRQETHVEFTEMKEMKGVIDTIFHPRNRNGEFLTG
jgi:hypothetical protein